jgi:CubicO group peptidase (beta-lactamase class C family)
LSWDLTIAESFPEFADSMNPVYKDVTLEQLVSHRGGINDDENIDPALVAKIATFDGSPRAMRVAFIPDFLRLNNVGPVGEFRYSNLGFALAAAIIERKTSTSFETMVKRLVLKPLNMKRAVLGSPGSNNKSDLRFARGHDQFGKALTPAEQPAPAGYSSAGLYSMPLGDWANFIKAHITQYCGQF